MLLLLLGFFRHWSAGISGRRFCLVCGFCAALRSTTTPRSIPTGVLRAGTGAADISAVFYARAHLASFLFRSSQAQVLVDRGATAVIMLPVANMIAFSADPMPPLLRTLRLTDLLLLFIGSVIGSGIFLTPGLILRRVDGSVGLFLLVWVVWRNSLACSARLPTRSWPQPILKRADCTATSAMGLDGPQHFFYGWCLFSGDCQRHQLPRWRTPSRAIWRKLFRCHRVARMRLGWP